MFFQSVYKGENDLWRYVLTVVGVLVALLFIGQIPLTIPIMQAYLRGDILLEDVENFQSNPDFSKVGLDQNIGIFLLLFSFVIALVALYLFVRFLHKRPFLSLVNYSEKINWNKVGFAFGLWFLIGLIPEVINYAIAPEDYTYQFQWRAFLPLLLISVLILPLQTSFEELFMRGYLMQGIGLASGNRWLPLILTSLIFGLMHSLNPEIGKFGFWLMMPYYVGTGLFLGIITLMDDSLDLALGVHAATNFFASTVVTFDGSALQTPAIFRVSEINVDLMIPVFFVFAALFTLICYRKYKWKDWTRLWSKIERPQEDAVAESQA